MPKLNWKLLTKKRAGVTQGLPPGKEDLAWVTNTVTLIYGERDAEVRSGLPQTLQNRDFHRAHTGHIHTERKTS